jgi:hypothetical protein
LLIGSSIGINVSYAAQPLIFEQCEHSSSITGISCSSENCEHTSSIAGASIRIQSTQHNGTMTYARQCHESLSTLRTEIEKADEKGRCILGEKYSYTPLKYQEYRSGRNFGCSPGTIPGGGFFLTVETLPEERCQISSHAYALNILRDQLQNLSGLPISQIQNQADYYSMDYIVSQYFECIKLPEDGDLVVYYDGIKIMHSGIHRKSEPNWNSPLGGTVESKWGLFSSFVFQHDVFFIPNVYGNTAKFYRVKKEKAEATIPPKENNNMSILSEDGVTFIFDNDERNNEIRREISSHSLGYSLFSKFPQIREIKHINFMGVCSDYAFGQVVGTYRAPPGVDSDRHTDMHKKIVEKYFTVTTCPTKGDLVVYYQLNSPVHWGVYHGENLVQSKWGKGSVYLHPPFYVDKRYGDRIRYYKINDGLTAEQLLTRLEDDHKM